MGETARILEARSEWDATSPLLRGLHATYAIEVDTGEACEVWNVRVDDGHVHIDQGPAQADCTLRADDPDMARILRGEQNPVTAAMQGLLEVEGDLALAQRFDALLPVRPA